MKAKVIKTFKDYRNQIIRKGSYIEVDYDRAIRLSNLGLIICDQEVLHKEDMMRKLAKKMMDDGDFDAMRDAAAFL